MAVVSDDVHSMIVWYSGVPECMYTEQHVHTVAK